MPNIGIMSYIRYKTFGKNKYAYEVTSYWDCNTKSPRQKVRYLGRVDDTGEIIKRSDYKKEKYILDFGDGFLLSEVLKKTGIEALVKEVFKKNSTLILSLLSYRLLQPSAMMYAQNWYEGNVVRFIYKTKDLSSQSISRVLKILGDERLQREFFRRYISSFTEPIEGIIIDTTALPNQIKIPINEWGYHDSDIDKQIKLLCVVDRNNKLHLYYRYLPGNIVDVSTLSLTIQELKGYGISKSFVLTDAGFFSEENIKGLYHDGIDFISRLPSSRIIYRELIEKEAKELEKVENATVYGKRALFIKTSQIELYGNKAYAYIVLDPERKARETKRLIIDALQGEGLEDIEYKLKKQGIMILVSSMLIDKNEVVSVYYLKQAVEHLFGFSKDDLRLVPLRVHTEETLRGYLFLIFVALIVFARLKNFLGTKYTVEEATLILRNLKCKIYDDELFVQELTKKQKDIFNALDLIVPKKMGI